MLHAAVVWKRHSEALPVPSDGKDGEKAALEATNISCATHLNIKS